MEHRKRRHSAAELARRAARLTARPEPPRGPGPLLGAVAALVALGLVLPAPAGWLLLAALAAGIGLVGLRAMRAQRENSRARATGGARVGAEGAAGSGRRSEETVAAEGRTDGRGGDDGTGIRAGARLRARLRGLALRWRLRAVLPDDVLVWALALPVLLAVWQWAVTGWPIRLGLVVVLPQPPDWQPGAAILLAMALTLAAPALGRWGVGLGAGITGGREEAKTGPRPGTGIGAAILGWALGSAAFAYAVWATGAVALAVACCGLLLARGLPGLTVCAAVAALVIGVLAPGLALLAGASVLAVGLVEWLLSRAQATPAMGPVRGAVRGAAGWRRGAALALWLGWHAAVAALVAAVPAPGLGMAGRALILMLVILPAVLAPVLAAAVGLGPVLLRMGARGGLSGAIALGLHLGTGLALALAAAGLSVATLAACQLGCIGVIAPPVPVVQLLRIDPSGHLWLFAVWLAPLVPAAGHLVVVSGAMAAALFRPRGGEAAPAIAGALGAGAALAVLGWGLWVLISGPLGPALGEALLALARLGDR